MRLSPQKDWPANEPVQLGRIVAVLELVYKEFNARSLKKVSMAELIVLGGGCVGVDQAERNGKEWNAWGLSPLSRVVPMP
ncbi:peroxidase family protein [Candidatus Methylacidiphilum infernorum]|uniref:peroxidase family protein n=1 Tax=Candidatus Methylacidiphilum infernorum TaxID=511746 RepID=UPI001F5DD032|nr:peroxidase family protein [Candidatus Methylacidiphilum infernorum]